MKFVLVFLFAILTIDSYSVNDTLNFWNIKGKGIVNVAQGKAINWMEGSVNSFSLLSVLNLKANYADSVSKWDNSLDLKFGFLKTDDYDLRKNEDKIEISSKYGRKLFGNWNYSGYVSFKSQLFSGYNYPNDSVIISGFLSPAYLITSFGLDYKPSNKFSVLISPISSKTTIITNAKVDETKFGLEKGERIKREIGAYINIKHEFEVLENVVMENKLELFSNYSNNPERVDIDWELKLTLKVNKYLNTTINTHFIYDDDMLIPIYEDVNGVKTKIKDSKRIQFKELLSVGLVYNIDKKI